MNTVERPKSMPYEAIEDNIPLLEHWLLEKFSDVFNIDQYTPWVS